MPLSEAQIKKLRELDVRSGGLVESTYKANANEQKTLIIGLGGMGGRVMSRVKTKLAQRVNYTDSQIRILAIDSDIGDLQGREEDNFDQIGLQSGKETFQIYFDGADSILHNEAQRSEFYKKWLNINFAQRLQGYGAGQVRQAGRALLLGNRYSSLAKLIKTAMTGLCGDGLLNRLEVHIVAGIAGGTGSGSFIDMPNIVRQAFTNHGAELHNLRLNGYLLMPSVMYNLPRVNETDRQGFAVNGYAALKELDYYMGKPYRVGNTTKYNDEFLYPEGGSVSLRHLESLYDICTMVSGTVGGAIAANIDTYAIDVTAETIINMLIDSKEENVVDGNIASTSFHIGNSFLDNCQRKTNDLESAPPSDAIFAKDAYYKYCATGVGTASMPSEALMAYVGSKIFKSLSGEKFRKGLRVNVDTVRTFVARSIMPPSALFEKIKSDNNYKVTVREEDRPGVKDVSANSVRAFETAIAQKKLQLSLTRMDLVDSVLTQAINQFATSANSHLNEFGPYELVQIFKMFKDPSNNDFCEGIEQKISGFVKEMQEIVNTQENKRSINSDLLIKAKEKIVSMGFIRIGISPLHRKALDQYVNCYIEDANIELLSEAAKRLTQEMKRFTDHIMKYSVNCLKLTEVLDEIEKVLSDGQDVFEQGIGAASVGQRYNLNLLDSMENPNMYAWAKAKLDTVIANVNLTQMAHGIINDFCQNPLSWTAGDHEFLAHKKIKSLFNSVLGNDVRITIRDYFDRILQLDGQPALQEEISKICDTIKDFAQPMFAFITGYPAPARQVSNAYIIVPDDLSNEVKQVFVAHAALNNMQISFSSAAGQVTCYNIIAGLPLYADRFMQDYEERYTRGNIEWQHLNERLNDQDNLSWRLYPPVISNTIWSAIEGEYRNLVEENYLTNTFYPLLQRAKNAGILFRSGEIGPYQVNVIHNVDRLAAEEAANEYCRNFSQRNTVIPKGNALLMKLSKLPDSINVFPVRLQKIVLDSANSGEAEAYKNACTVLRKHVPLYLMLKDTLKIYEVAEAVVDKHNQSILLDQAISEYLNVVGAGLIFEENKCWYVRLGNTETSPLFDMNRAEYIDETRRFTSPDLIYYAVFEKYLQLEDRRRQAVGAIACELRDKGDIVAFGNNRRPIILSSQEFVCTNVGNVNMFNIDQLCGEIGQESYEKALRFYRTCAGIGR